MIGFITLTPAGSILDSAGRSPELLVNPAHIAALKREGSSTLVWIGGDDFHRVNESIEQIETLVIRSIAQMSGSGQCRVCGCTEYQACQDPVSGEPCHWVAPDLCSACADLPATEARS